MHNGEIGNDVILFTFFHARVRACVKNPML